MCDVSEGSKAITVNDDLGLTKISVDHIPNNILFPEELNLYLRGQIEFLTHANGLLQRTVSQKDSELREINQKLENLNCKLSDYELLSKDLNGYSTNGSSSHLMSSKIVELSKKLRDKNSELESIKSRLSRLQHKIVELERQDDKNNVPHNFETTAETYTKKNDLNEETKSLQEKLNAANNKLFETKNINLQLKNDLKLANKILQQELGESFTTIQNLAVANNATWRGRAQQIISLQQKNSELQEKLSIYSDKELTATPPQKVDNRKLIIEQLNKELCSAKSDHEETRKKLNGARARIKVLETECYSLKSKLGVLTEKNNHDDNLTKILKGQLINLEDSYNNLMKDKQVSWQKLEIDNKNLNIELQKEYCRVENLKKNIYDKDIKINELQHELSHGKSILGSTIRPNSTESLILKENNSRLNVLEVEVQRLLELVEVLNNRLDNERNQHTDTDLKLKKERQKAAKLETKLMRMEIESSLFKPQTYSKSSSKSITSVNSNIEDNNALGLESVKNSLELAEEHIKILESKLNILQREKNMDYQRFVAILNDSKNIMKKEQDG